MDTTFIYALCEPGTRTVRYIGMTKNPKQRFKSHMCCSIKRASYLGNWVRGIKARGEKPSMVILREVPRRDWKMAEERYIRLARGLGMRLVNATDGGDGGEAFNSGVNHPQFGKTGPESHNFGRKHSEEGRKNMSLAHLGHQQSVETIAKRSAVLRAYWEITPCPNLGKKQSKETIALRKETMDNKTEEEKLAWTNKQREAKKGKPWPPARRAAHEARKAAK